MPRAHAQATLTPGLLVLLGSITLFGPIGTDAFLPALPQMATALAAPASSVQLALTGFTAGMALGQLVAGPVSDAVGRRRPLLVGTVGMAAASLSAALAGTATALVVSCAAMGLFAAVGIVVSRATVADLAHGSALTRAYALLGTLTGIGPVLGPLIGVALLLVFGWRGIFVGLGVFAAAGFVAALVRLPESRPPDQRSRGGLRTFVRNLSTVLRTRTFLAAAGILWITFAAMFAYISASSFVMQVALGFSALGYTVAFSVNGLGLIAAAAITARLSGRIADRRIVAIGLSSMSLGACLVLAGATIVPASAWILLPGMFVLASSMGFIFGPCSAMALFGLRHASGTALALLGAVQFLLAGLVAPLAGIAGEDEVLPFALVVAACVVVAWAVWSMLLPRASSAEA